MKSYYVYILLCADGLTYTGFTNNISRRFDEHQLGKNKICFTFKRRPVELIFHQEFNDVHQAIYFEKTIKKWSGKKKIALANGEYDMLQILAECQMLLIQILSLIRSRLRSTGQKNKPIHGR